MALARGIWLWLPLENLVQLRASNPALPTDAMIYERLQVLNQLDLSYLQAREAWPGDLWIRYLRVCTQQGEFSSQAFLFLPATILAARPAALGNYFWYRFYVNRDQNKKGQVEALYSGVPAIQALLLSRVAARLYEFPMVLDPRGGPWTRGLARVVADINQNQRLYWMPQRFLGFLEHRLAPNPDLHYLTGDLAYHMLRSPDPFEHFQSPVNFDNLNVDRPWAGYYHGNSKPLHTALEFLDARAVEIFLRKYPNIRPTDLPRRPQPPDGISQYFCRRAEAMYRLAQSRPDLNFPKSYLLYLRALAGLPLPVTELADPDLATEDRDGIKRTMTMVAHPDLQTAALDPRADLPTAHIGLSEVLYDVPNLLRACATIEIDQRDIVTLLQHLYVRGQLLTFRDNLHINSVLFQMFDRVGARLLDGALNVPKSEATTREYYQLLSSEPTPI